MHLVNINGQIFPGPEARVSVLDRGFLFGDSVYEVTRTYNRKIFLWREHWERMNSSAARIGFEIPFSEDEMLKETLKLLKELNRESVYIRWIVTRGEGEIGLDPKLATRANFVIIVRTLQDNPPEWYREGISLLISGVRRNAIKALDPKIKSGNYLNNMMALREAKEKGFFDGIMMNSEGALTEGSTFNFWAVKGGVVRTPPVASGILMGITREKLKNLIKQKSEYEFSDAPLFPEEALKADECFITSSTKELVPVVRLGDQPIGTGRPGPVYSELHGLFRQWRDERLNCDQLEY